MRPYYAVYVAILCYVSHRVLSERYTCSFPNYVLSKPRWEKNIEEERRKTGEIVKFYPDKFVITKLNTNLPTEVEYSIVSCEIQDKFVMQISQEDKYICMSLIKRTSNVLQWKWSAEVLNSDDSSICNDDKLVLDKWPLIWPYVDPASYEVSPLLGGYTMQVYDNGAGTYLCKDYWLPPELESECVEGDGIEVNFRQIDCLGNLGMNLLQNLYSLGTWREGNYEYTVVSNEDDLWPRIWMLRMSSGAKNANKFDLDVFTSIATIDGIEPFVSHFYTWSLSKKKPIGACEDTLEDFCSVKDVEKLQCDVLRLQYCKKSCGLCNNKTGGTLDQCDFLEKVQGSWQSVSISGVITEKIILEGISMNMGLGSSVFKCYNSFENPWVKGFHRKPMRAIYENGCLPRYVCLEAELKSSNVLMYRVGKITKDSNVDNVCFDEQFDTNEKNIIKKNTFASKDKQILYKQNANILSDCGQLQKLFLAPFKKVEKAKALFFTGQENDTDVLMTDCSSDSTVQGAHDTAENSNWRCLAHYDIKSTNFLIVKTDDEEVTPNVQCWIIHRNEWSVTAYFYQVALQFCNKDAPIFIQIGQLQEFLAAYTISNETYCDVITTSTTTNTITRNTTSSTTLSTISTSSNIEKHSSTLSQIIDSRENGKTTKRLVTQNIPPLVPSNNTYDVKAQKSTSIGNVHSPQMFVFMGLLVAHVFEVMQKL